MNNPQIYAVKIEQIMSDVFECDRFGLGGIVNSDYIRENPYSSMVSTLMYRYANADTEQRNAIINFIEKYSFFGKANIDTILKSDIEKETAKNGEEAVESIINDFSNLCMCK